MNKHILYLSLTGLLLLVAACNKDDIEEGSIFNTEAPARNEFDQWLQTNYVAPYNIDVKYKWEDMESNFTYDLVPAGYRESQKLAKVIKYVWLEAYDEVAGIDFMRTYVPKQIFIVGSAAYNADTQTTMLGTAEGGMKIVLYNVNEIDTYLNDIESLTTSYFHVMHHEFSHVLHQTKPYSPDFKTITESGYIGSQWAEKADTFAQKRGFVTAYAMDQPDEDFVEVIATYITHDQAWWDNLLESCGESGAESIRRKLGIVKNYLRDLWNIDINRLRAVVLRRTGEIPEIDLTTLNP